MLDANHSGSVNFTEFAEMLFPSHDVICAVSPSRLPDEYLIILPFTHISTFPNSRACRLAVCLRACEQFGVEAGGIADAPSDQTFALKKAAEWDTQLAMARVRPPAPAPRPLSLGTMTHYTPPLSLCFLRPCSLIQNLNACPHSQNGTVPASVLEQALSRDVSPQAVRLAPAKVPAADGASTATTPASAGSAGFSPCDMSAAITSAVASAFVPGSFAPGPAPEGVQEERRLREIIASEMQRCFAVHRTAATHEVQGAAAATTHAHTPQFAPQVKDERSAFTPAAATATGGGVGGDGGTGLEARLSRLEASIADIHSLLQARQLRTRKNHAPRDAPAPPQNGNGHESGGAATSAASDSGHGIGHTFTQSFKRKVRRSAERAKDPAPMAEFIGEHPGRETSATTTVSLIA